MPPRPIQNNEVIIVVGAGIFGLSTAIHLAKRGYSNVTIYDKQPYHETQYEYLRGCEAASADVNKLFRTAYGAQIEYQNLCWDAVKDWNKWNSELESGLCVPKGMSTRDKLFINNGCVSLTDKSFLPDFEIESVRNANAAGHADAQLITTNSLHAKVAREKGFGYGIDPFRRKSLGKGYLGVLDISGGVLVADRACRFALHKAQSLGVKTIFDPLSGCFDSLSIESGQANGIKTKDGKVHLAQRIIMACGAWTSNLIPALNNLCEATLGSVAMIKIPKSSALYSRYSPERFPAWMYKLRDGADGGVYGFPVSPDGYMKLGYRGTKYTNPKLRDNGIEISAPITGHGTDEKLTGIPLHALEVMKSFIAEFMPDIIAEGLNIEFTRGCWYTDSWDNHFVVDYLPGQDRVLVATAGSGHAFKFLPNIGNWVVDIMEGVGVERPLTKAWKWRSAPAKGQEKVVNFLLEGSKGVRALANTKLSDDQDLLLCPEAGIQSKL